MGPLCSVNVELSRTSSFAARPRSSGPKCQCIKHRHVECNLSKATVNHPQFLTPSTCGWFLIALPSFGNRSGLDSSVGSFYIILPKVNKVFSHIRDLQMAECWVANFSNNTGDFDSGDAFFREE